MRLKGKMYENSMLGKYYVMRHLSKICEKSFPGVRVVGCQKSHPLTVQNIMYCCNDEKIHLLKMELCIKKKDQWGDSFTPN
jgi:hypothetical protein